MKVYEVVQQFLIMICLCGLLVLSPALGLGRAAAQSGQVVRVGFFQNYPLTFEKGGRQTGFHLELLREVARQEGWTLDLHYSGSLKNVVQGLENGSLDLGMGLVPTDALRQFLDFTAEKNAMLTGQIFVRAGREDSQQVKDLSGKKVAILNHDGLGQACLDVCKKLGVEPVVHLINSYDELAQAVSVGAVDAALFSAAQGADYAKLYHLQSTAIVFKPVTAQFAVAKGKNGDLTEAIDRSLRQWKKEKGAKYYELERTFLGGVSSVNGTWTGREMLIAVCLCLLFIVMGVNMGIFMVKETESNSLRVAGASLRKIGTFTVLISLIFWGMDSLAGWLLFNEGKDLSLLEFAVTRVPPENLYMRAMFFLMCCFFGIFMANYIRKYEELLNVLYVSVGRFDQLIGNAKDMLYRMSLPKGEYEFVNKASMMLFGYSPEEFYKRPHLLDEMVHPDWKEYYANEWEKILAGEEVALAFEYQVLNKAGQKRWVNQRLTVYRDDSGVPVAIEGMITDLTESKEAR
jgi:PAS domain S-box-containing protein